MEGQMSQAGRVKLLAVGTVLVSLVPAWAMTYIIIADFSAGLDARGIPSGWQLKEKAGKADLAVVKEGKLHALHLRSADSSFSLQKTVDVDIRRYPVLSWKWKVTELPPKGDFRKSNTDDQAAQLFVAFSWNKAIVYIWDTTAPQGFVGEAAAPMMMTIKAIVVRSGAADTGKWITETRNVFEDYRQLFGQEPPPVGGIRIQINSQHTNSTAESYFAEVSFKKV